MTIKTRKFEVDHSTFYTQVARDMNPQVERTHMRRLTRYGFFDSINFSVVITVSPGYTLSH